MMLRILALLLLAATPVAAQMQSDCRGSGTIGNAVMGADGTITLSIQGRDGRMGVFAYRKGEPQYARILSHIGGIRPGQHKPVPSFCN